MKHNKCYMCGNLFPCSIKHNGKRLYLYKRKTCTACVPIGDKPPYYGSLRYSREEFEAAVRNSCSIRDTLLKLGLNGSGAAYTSFKRACKEWHVSTSHFTGQLWAKNVTLGPKRSISDYLSNQYSISSHKLKQRLLREGIFNHQCSSCQLTEWLGRPIPIELDHINGDHGDNRLENLRILCPNCHAQTDTHAGKNRGKTNAA